MPSVTLLSSGYYLVRWSPNLWIQWPHNRQATQCDGFGWITNRHVEEANRLTQEGANG